MKKKVFSIAALILAFCIALPVFASANKAIAVRNGDFERYSDEDRFPDAWSFHSYEAEARELVDNSVAVCEEDPERGGVAHIKVEADDDAALYQTLKVEPSTIYKLNCYIKTKGIENGRGANIGLREVIARTDGLFGDNDWTLVELVGKTGPFQEELIISCRVGNYGEEAHGEAWFDDFTIEKIESYDGDILPFYQGVTDSGEGSEEEESPVSILPILLISVGVIAAGVIAALAISARRKNGKASEENGKIPPIESYSKDKARKLTGMDEVRGMSFFNTREDMPGATDNKLHFKKKDWIFCLALTAVYAVISIVRLGTTSFPTNAWNGDAGDSVRIEFGRSVKLSDVWQNSGISYCDYTLTTDSGDQIAFQQNDRNEYGHMFRWTSLGKGSVSKAAATTGVTVTVNSGDSSRGKDPDAVINELVFFDDKGEKVECRANGPAMALIDEQDTVPDYPSYYTGMYFDELYHGRTALEHINNMKVYEWTHPPLGKLIIAIGISIFGMNPFGWRIMGVLFGIAMVPIMYCFGKRVLKRSELALFASFLFTFDFMHFTMARISTIDTYGVFFIMLMTYYMYQFVSMDIGDSSKKMLKPLALSGLFFGLGCASKWICIYTGAALAIMFFAKLIVMGVKSARLSHRNKYRDSNLVKKYWSKFGLLCSWCVIFFIIVPVVIYCASYCRYYTAQWKPERQRQIYNADPDQYDSVNDVRLGLGDAVETYVKGVIKNQNDMFSYHSQLKSDHSGASSWWMWLGDMRPTWFYKGGTGNPNGYVGSISAFGNPAVWILCNISVVVLIFILIIHRRRLTTEDFVLFACLASSLLPWVLVPRSTYAYHFYASVPFITLLAGRLIGYWEDVCRCKREMNGRKGYGPVSIVKYIWMALVLLMFVLFYPVISGMEVPATYAHALEWMPFYKIELQDTAGTVLKTYRIGWRFLDYEPREILPGHLITWLQK